MGGDRREDTEKEMEAGDEDISELTEKVPSPEKSEDSEENTDESPAEISSLWVSSSDPETVERKILEHMTSLPGGEYACKVCGKASRGRSAKTILRQHIETHLEGLAYPCQHCDRTLRTRNALRAHRSANHRTSL